MTEPWIYLPDGRRRTALSTAELERLVRRGKISPQERVFSTEHRRWQTAAAALAIAPQDVTEAEGPTGWMHSWLLPVLGANAVVLATVLLLVGLIPRTGGRDSSSHAAIVPAAAPPSLPAETFEDQVRPLLAKYCFDCHGPEKQKGDLDLAVFQDEAGVLRGRRTWNLVYRQLHTREMPPEKKPQPTIAERNRITDWIEQALRKIDCDGPQDPGRVTIRRLNRAEYNNTIRDLLGVKLRPADDFPSDDVGAGFDNIAEVLSLPPILLEKYLDAAEMVLDAAIVTEAPVATRRHRLEAERLRSSQGRASGPDHWLTSNGEIFTPFHFPAAGRYRLRVRAWGDQAGNEKVKMAIRLDGKTLKEFSVVAPQNRPADHEVTAEVRAGSRRVAVAFLNDYYQPQHRDPGQRDRNLIVDRIDIEGPLDAKPPELPASHQRIFVARPGPDLDEAEAARQIIDRFAARAFRRPATEAEVNKFLDLFRRSRAAGDDFEMSVKVTLAAVLVNPQFLYRIEQDRPESQLKAPDEAWAISDWELATRLSYFLWSSMPDRELFDLARAGKLRAPGVLEKQVRRMLGDEKAGALVENFAGQWLQLRALQQAMPDRIRFDYFDAELGQAMYDEATMFFEQLMRHDGRLLDVLDADYSFLNERLARHYGIEGVTGPQLRRVDLPDRRRGGVLTMAAILTTTSDPAHTSPVMRGKWVLEQILGTPPPPPPPGVSEIAEEIKSDPSLSTRQVLERHRADPDCASCHKRMDPIGLALENYDPVGRWREVQNSQPIDASGVLPNGQAFDGPIELKAILAGRPRDFAQCLSEKMLTYALGRQLEHYDFCALKQIVDRLEGNDYRFNELIVGIARSRPFNYRRRAQPDEVDE